MNRGRRDALVIAASLTLALGILSHVLVEAAVMGDRLDLFTPSHVLLAVLSVAVLAWSIVRIGGARGRSERRRNRALLRSSLRADTPTFYLVAALAQSVIAAGILLFEGIAVAPGQMLAAGVSGLLAVLAGSLVLRLARRRIVAILSHWARAIVRGARVLCRDMVYGALRPCATLLVLRTRPDRAPPVLLIA